MWAENSKISMNKSEKINTRKCLLMKEMFNENMNRKQSQIQHGKSPTCGVKASMGYLMRRQKKKQQQAHRWS